MATQSTPRRWRLAGWKRRRNFARKQYANGSTIEIEARDIQISVHGLIAAILQAILPTRTVATIFASRGGNATSAAKRRSVQANGLKGGSPRKRSKSKAA